MYWFILLIILCALAPYVLKCIFEFLFYSPLHMSVLMRKPELVKRYCCVLQILESSIDLINDEKLVSTFLFMIFTEG